ncbi:unnamed protein product [Spirodela intermedia]|uniref:Uncharacterized protein n=1 Tax=Spirodela intermedia TaxID=51605 RepID=A0A7I8KHK3_SPIIN|nr:unnamed protein product [Spirodela intermedia]
MAAAAAAFGVREVAISLLVAVVSAVLLAGEASAADAPSPSPTVGSATLLQTPGVAVLVAGAAFMLGFLHR